MFAKKVLPNPPVAPVLSVAFDEALWSTEHTSFHSWVTVLSCAVATGLSGDTLLPKFVPLGSLCVRHRFPVFLTAACHAGAHDTGFACELFHMSILLALWNEAQQQTSEAPTSASVGLRGEIGCMGVLRQSTPSQPAFGHVRGRLSAKFSSIFQAAVRMPVTIDGPLTCGFQAAALALDTLAMLRVVCVDVLLT